MSKFDNKKIMPRYFAIAVVLTLTGIAILCKAAYIMSAKKEYWTEVAAGLKSDGKQYTGIPYIYGLQGRR